MLPLHVYVVAILLFTHHGHSQKEGASCVIEHTNNLGVCARATTCQSARRDYQINGILPTFCRNHSLLIPIICCSNGSSILNNNRDWSNNQQKNRDNKRLSEKKCEEFRNQTQIVTYLPLLEHFEPISISVPTCDYVAENIFEQRYAATGVYPHLAAIGWANFEGTYSFLCDGSLISTKFVLTAAHCTKYSKMKDPNPVIVRLGDPILDPIKNDDASSMEVSIKNIRKHPQYKSPDKYHDIALLELASDIDFNMKIRPACLWYRRDFPEYGKAVAVGRGIVDLHTQATSDKLQRFSLSLLKNDQCNYLLRTKKSWFWADELTDNQICAADLIGQKDTCMNNTGSPLQVVSHGNNCVSHVIGVTSFGTICTQSDGPVVYTRVTPYLDWIESVVWPGES